MFKLRTYVLFVLLLVGLLACVEPIKVPSANVKADATLVAVGAVVRLDGSSSSDPQSLHLYFRWSFAEVPAGSTAVLVEPETTKPHFTADVAGDYVVALAVSNGTLTSGPTTVKITAGPCGTNLPIVASITANPAAPNVGQPVGLSASVTDADVDAPCNIQRRFSYKWLLANVPLGSTAAISAPAGETPFFTPDVEGEYEVSLIVTDELGRASDPNSIKITVGTCGVAVPVVDSITASPGNPAIGQNVQLTPAVSDADTIAPCSRVESFTYAWSLVGQPVGSAASLNNKIAEAPTFVPDQPGDYVFALIVTDSTGRPSAPKTVVVSSSACNGNAPVVTTISASPANPGVEQNVLLTPQITDADALAPCNIAESFTYAWSIQSLPPGSQAALNSASVVMPSFTPDVDGVYTLSLVVTDSNKNTSAPKTISVPVSTCGQAPPTIAPIVASPAAPNTDQIVQLSAPVSDADNAAPCQAGQTFTYAWSIASAPAGSKVSLNLPGATSPSFVPDVPGSYSIQVVVHDSTGRSSMRSTTVNVSVCGSANPTALVQELTPDLAGPGPSVIATNAPVGSVVQVSGVASNDADNAAPCNMGQALSYSWSFLALPAGSKAKLNDTMVVDPSFVADVPGTFVIGLIVTDSTNRSSSVAQLTITADPAVGLGLFPGFTIVTVGAGPLFNGPRGITKDGAGNIYIAQSSSNVLKIAPNGSVSKLTTGGMIFSPQDIAFDAASSTLFTSVGFGGVVKISLAGLQTPCINGSNADYRGVEIYSGTGGLRLMAADDNNSRVAFINPLTCTVASTNDFDNGNNGKLNNPWGVTAKVIGGVDNAFVTDAGNDEIWRNLTGSYSTNQGTNVLISASNLLNTPRDVVTTPCATAKLMVANRGGKDLLLFANQAGAGASVVASGMQAPVGLFFEDANNLLITDEVLNAVFRMSGPFCSL